MSVILVREGGTIQWVIASTIVMSYHNSRQIVTRIIAKCTNNAIVTVSSV